MTPEALGSLSRAELVALVLALDKRVRELEARLGQPPKTPDNSSLPPSRGIKPSAVAVTGPKSKNEPHGGAFRALDPDPTTVREERLSVCPRCGAAAHGLNENVLEEYDHIDLPPVRPVVTRVRLMGGRCACCGARVKAPPPANMVPGSPFGLRLRGLILDLRFSQGIGLERLSKLLADVFGLQISEGALVNILASARPAFLAQRGRIAQDLKAGTVIESDETGLRVGKTNGWLWLFQHGPSAVFEVARRRSREAVAAFLGTWRPAFWLSDRYGAQLGWATNEQQICLAHLARDLQYVKDRGETVFAPKLLALLGRACRIGRRRSRLADATLKVYAAQLNAALDRILAQKPQTTAAAKLLRLIKKVRRHLFVFVTNRALEATNNGCERALRPAVTFRKIINGFRTDWGADLYAAIRSVLETARRRNLKPLDAIELTLKGLPLPKPA